MPHPIDELRAALGQTVDVIVGIDLFFHRSAHIKHVIVTDRGSQRIFDDFPLASAV